MGQLHGPNFVSVEGGSWLRAVTKLTHEDGIQDNNHEGFARFVFVAVCISPLEEPCVHDAHACERTSINFAYDAVRIEVGLGHSHIAVNEDRWVDGAA